MANSDIDYFRNLLPFKDLPQDQYDYLEENIQVQNYAKDIVIFRAGDEGDCFYIIKKGSVRVFINAPVSNEKITLSTLKEGDFFGEMALLTGGPRSASVETTSDVSLIKLDKKVFSKILDDEPQISIQISNMLSQRLMQANLQRAAAEQFYQSKISPSGTLDEHPVMDILKFCEQNSLTGKLYFEQENDQAEISYLKGNVQKVQLGKLKDAEAMDAITEWRKGKFRIEPSLFSLEENVVEETNVPDIDAPAKKNSPEISDAEVQDILEKFIQHSFEKLTNMIGSQKLKELANLVYKQCLPYFPVLEKCSFEIVPDIKVELKNIAIWSEKETLAIAVYLETIFKNCMPLVVGMSFLDFEELAGDGKEQLEKISFFQYMDHAKEFAL